ncbi:hypothetical protein DFH06DRAFT_728746 [Mycena polygramma]|nr:hypothetical protein DFH06DRAFT_728746 [Mycena polygramma]
MQTPGPADREIRKPTKSPNSSSALQQIFSPKSSSSTIPEIALGLAQKRTERVYPRIPRPARLLDSNASFSSAQLKLPFSAPCIGQGSHSAVYQAHLILDERFRLATQQSTSEVSRPVRVAAKIPANNDYDLTMLENEAQTYTAFPEHLSEDWSGFNAIGEAVSSYTNGRVPATAVVPKFYGYFVPYEQLETGRARPILLLEDCGRPIEPRHLKPQDRNICFTFLHSLYRAGFIQNSFYERNLLVQPGPLTHPPDQRSTETPSFRLVDFGRAQRWDDFLSKATGGIREKQCAKVTPSNNDSAFAAAANKENKPDSESRESDIASEIKAAEKQAKAEWVELLLAEQKTAKDTVFGKLREFRCGFDKWCDGRQEAWSYTRTAREWVFTENYPRRAW